MNSRVLDINCDMGESYGSWVKGNDEALMSRITTANVACGFHASDPVTMLKTVKLAKQNGVQIDLGAKYSRSSGLSTNTGLNRLVWYEIIEADRERRDLVVECLNAIPGVECPLPGATIYAFPDISYYGIASNELSADILDKTHVAVESECSA